MSSDTSVARQEPAFSQADQDRLIQSMFTDGRVGKKQEQILLLENLLTALRNNKLIPSCLEVATRFQLGKEGDRVPSDTSSQAFKDTKTLCRESAKKLLQRLHKTLTVFYSRPSGEATPWIVKLEHERTSGGRPSWVLSVEPKDDPKTTSLSTPMAKPPIALALQTANPMHASISPPVLGHFIRPSEIFESLRKKVLSGSRPLSMTAVVGMGGVGKTMMATALCHDRRVQEAFPDGILWLTFGAETKRTFEDRVKSIAHQLNQEFQVRSTSAYKTLLEDKAVLLVLDDVWDVGEIQPFLLNSGRSRLMFTTRDKTIARSLGGDTQVQEVTPLDDLRARRLLGHWSGRGTRLPELHTSGILEECQGLPLALAMIGAALRDEGDEHWAAVLCDLRQARLRNVGAKLAGYDRETLHAALAVSVNALVPNLRDRYLRLALLPEDMVAAPPVLQALWGVSVGEVHATVRALAGKSLVRSERAGLVLHDLQLKYVREEHPYPKSLALQRSAFQRSAHVVGPHPEQFAGQMTGRLLSHSEDPSIDQFLKLIAKAAPRPWLRPVSAGLDPADGPAIRVLQGHRCGVTAVAITKDGSRIISGSLDKTVIVWDHWNRNKRPRVLRGHKYAIYALALTHDESRLFSACRDRRRVLISYGDMIPLTPAHATDTIIGWNLEVRRRPFVLEDPTRTVSGLALTPDGQNVISGSIAGVPVVWDISGRKAPRALKGPRTSLEALTITPDGRHIITGSCDGTIMIWDLFYGRSAKVLGRHKQRVCALAVTSDGRYVVSGSDDKAVMVWHLNGHRPPRTLEGHQGPVLAVAVSVDGKRVVSGAMDSKVFVWDLSGQQRPRVLEGHQDIVTCVAVSPDGHRVVSGSMDKTLIVWDLNSDRSQVYRRPIGLASGLKISTEKGSTHIRVDDLADRRQPRILEGHGDEINQLKISRDGRRLVSASDDKTAIVWDLEGQQGHRVLKGHVDEVWVVAITPDGRRVVSGSADKTLRVWDVDDERWSRLLKGHKDEVTAVAITEDGKRVVSASYDNTLRVWDVENSRKPLVIKGHSGPAFTVDITPDGRFVASGFYQKTVMIWDLQGQRQPVLLKGHKDVVFTVAIRADGQRLVSGSKDNSAILWDLEQGKQLAVFMCDAPVVDSYIGKTHIELIDGRGKFHRLMVEE